MNMWYVIQTFTGKEQEVAACINLKIDKHLFNRCFVPLYEDVWRKGGVGHISIKRMFAGYVFVHTDTPIELYEELKRFPKLTILLYTREKEFKELLSLHPEEEVFFDTILSEGTMRVSYVHVDGKGKIDTIIGPLHDYADHIVKVDLSHRRAMVEIPMLGETKTVKFGLWTDRDEKLGWIEEAKKKPEDYKIKVSGTSRKATGSAENYADRSKGAGVIAAEYNPGDKVICTRGIYGDTPLEIVEVRLKKSTVILAVPMFGTLTKVEMSMDDITPVE